MSVVIADKSAVARMEKPIMATLTDREKALVEAAREVMFQWEKRGIMDGECFLCLGDALLPYKIEETLREATAKEQE